MKRESAVAARIIDISLGFFGFLCIADLVITYVVLHHGGYEGNPLMSGVIHTPIPVLLKAVCYAVIFWACRSLKSYVACSILLGISLLYTFVVIHNMIILNKAV